MLIDMVYGDWIIEYKGSKYKIIKNYNNEYNIYDTDDKLIDSYDDLESCLLYFII